jgi:hypothetical protein
MQGFKYGFVAAAAAALCLMVPAPRAGAQVSIGVNIGEPNCPYGYYDYAPYNCAPDGYYGPEWFVGGRFIGAGKWFHGPANFHGSVNNHFDPQHGFKGPMPGHGAPQAPHAAFHANESRDGHGHAAPMGGHK